MRMYRTSSPQAEQRKRRWISLAYGSQAFSVAVINNVWVTYSYSFFLRALSDNSMAFVICHLLYMVWNSCNDPIFGWWSDTRGADPGIDPVTGLPRRKYASRLTRIRNGMYLLMIAFVFAFLCPYSNKAPDGISEESALAPALYYFFALSFFDGALTYVEINYASLLADMTSDEVLRTECNSAASLFSLFGGIGPMLASLMWTSGMTDEHWDVDIFAFRLFCVSCCVVALPCVLFTYTKLEYYHSKVEPEPMMMSHNEKEPQEKLSIKEFIGHIWNQKNFRIFALQKLLQSFCCTFEKNHLPLCLTVFQSLGYLDGSTIGLLLGASFMCPHVVVVLLTGFITRYGVHRGIKLILVVKLAVTLVGVGYLSSPGVVLDRTTILFITGVLVLMRVLAECVCRLFPLLMSQLVDEDKSNHHRPRSMAASIIGSTSFIAKPGETAAPILGWYLFSALLTDRSNTSVIDESTINGGFTAEKFVELLMVPGVVVMMELFLVSKYSLHAPSERARPEKFIV